MALFETWLKSDLKKPLKVEQLKGNLFSSDNSGNLVGVEVLDNGEAATITGNVTGYVIRADGATVAVTGTLSGNRASIILPASAYVVVGQASIAIKVGTTTVGACTAYVYRTVTDALVDPGHVIPSIEELLEKIADCEAATTAANSAATSATSAAGSANTAAATANTAANGADTAASGANTAASGANAAAQKIDGMTVAASGLSAGSSPTATVSEVSGHKHIAFGIPKGDTGATPNISVGTVTTLLPGASAYVTLAQSSTPEAPVFNFGIPKGDPGNIENVYASNIAMSPQDQTTIATAMGGKASKAQNPTANNFAALDANGNPIDSGHKHSDYKGVQTAVADPTASGTSVTFIAEITQNAQGVITPVKRTVKNMTAPNQYSDGAAGLVPAPSVYQKDCFLKATGWSELPIEVLAPSSAFSIPASGSSVSYNMDGMTADHELVRWNFSTSAENDPPANLQWTTYTGYFTITNNGGSTNETIKPVFVIPTEKTTTQHS